MKKNTIIDRIIDNDLIPYGSLVIIGLSGGPDSLCLLHALHRLSDSYELTLLPVHVNHKLRPEADAEADNVMRICDRMGLECGMYETDCEAVAKEMKVSTEEAGRYLRYDIFDEVAEQAEDQGIPAEKIVIALAHNADDQSETVLFRLLRGTTNHGLSGIPAARTSESGYTIVRPLLNVTRAEIEEYIRDNKLHPNIDKSNSQNDYTRNRIRNELIPYLEKNYNPNIKDVLRKFAALSYMDDSVLTDIAFEECETHLNIDRDRNIVMLDLDGIREDPPAIMGRIVNIILQALRLDQYASYELVTGLVALVYSSNPSARMDLPEGFIAYREYDTLIFAEEDGEEIIKADESLRMIPQVMMIRDYDPPEDTIFAAFDFDSFNREHPGKVGEITLRSRREGDYLPMRSGSKKIQDLLVDSKVKRSARDSILMVAIGSEIMWVLPSRYFSGRQEQEKGRFSPKYHINEQTERVLFIEIVDDM